MMIKQMDYLALGAGGIQRVKQMRTHPPAIAATARPSGGVCGRAGLSGGA